METPFAPIEVFYSFAEADALLLEQLERHLSLLRREGTIATWHKRQIVAGSNWQMEVDQHLNTASLILLLISSDFLASDYGYGSELQHALQRHEANEAIVVPLLLRPCDWQGAPFASLQVLPPGNRPITMWRDRDVAWTEVVMGMRRLLTEKFGAGKSVMQMKPIQPKPLELKMPGMGEYFLDRHDREYLIAIIDQIICPRPPDGIKNLLRGKLPDPQINRINFRDGSRNIAENIIGSLEPKGGLNPPHYHALGAFFNDLIEDEAVSYDDAVKIVALLFRYTLIKDRKQIIKLSAQWQVPSPLFTEETLTKHPSSPASLPNTIKITGLQERFESLYNCRRYLLDVKFLIQGAKAASSVCRIDFGHRGEGTGFLIAPDLILTNYHVMVPQGYKGDLNTRARRCEIKFGVIEGMSAGSCFKLHDKEWLVEQSKPEELDFMLLRLNRAVTEHHQISPLPLEANSVQSDEFVNIIQHPNGGSMAVSIRFNQVVAVEDNRIYYLADTEEGSSGSPVFDDSWRLVALHHAGGKLDEAGNLIVAANIGVPINAIREQIAVYLNN
jgi:V8-like Glu-specific endopeptidase